PRSCAQQDLCKPKEVPVMDILSWLLLTIIAVWFVWALVRTFRKGTCSCGGSTCGRCSGKCTCCDKSEK
ncbi:MAG: hypothetical protein IJA73_03490, partial [Oscillospiraceae bacterium]|nr:hypothetical protein [Oscillospiraceae bacterium]